MKLYAFIFPLSLTIDSNKLTINQNLSLFQLVRNYLNKIKIKDRNLARVICQLIRALCYSADRWGEDISAYCRFKYIFKPDIF